MSDTSAVPDFEDGDSWKSTKIFGLHITIDLHATVNELEKSLEIKDQDVRSFACDYETALLPMGSSDSRIRVGIVRVYEDERHNLEGKTVEFFGQGVLLKEWGLKNSNRMLIAIRYGKWWHQLQQGKFSIIPKFERIDGQVIVTEITLEAYDENDKLQAFIILERADE